MPDDYAQFFSATAQDTSGAYFTTLDTGGFTVGTTNNASGGIYYFVAFPEASGSIDVGTYTGDGSDDRSVTGVGFEPDYVLTKNAGGAIGAVSNQTESYGDYSSYFTDTANLVNAVQGLEGDGFQVGTSDRANASATTYYYAPLVEQPRLPQTARLRPYLEHTPVMVTRRLSATSILLRTLSSSRRAEQNMPCSPHA